MPMRLILLLKVDDQPRAGKPLLCCLPPFQPVAPHRQPGQIRRQRRQR